MTEAITRAQPSSQPANQATSNPTNVALHSTDRRRRTDRPNGQTIQTDQHRPTGSRLLQCALCLIIKERRQAGRWHSAQNNSFDFSFLWKLFKFFLYSFTFYRWHLFVILYAFNLRRLLASWLPPAACLVELDSWTNSWPFGQLQHWNTRELNTRAAGWLVVKLRILDPFICLPTYAKSYHWAKYYFCGSKSHLALDYQRPSTQCALMNLFWLANVRRC